ncbi:bll4820 [Bradyrhizobium diazoefficiens USDA 110]|uniref:Bll4820 protein n=1 Tax=Bradyrhizobium diazoefficiens (strain JCM 10833 / BCRC 13528 / IAM 13628 / NBRC 14792 / USDA 110) TaxID=224911 RepID=Q89KT3_BRADU|nr:hypothetical protein CO678_34945 [Bradyrhizobium diazoefficiens]QBP23602.1 hypothetical protein Bdiaspc4_25295 [Bradyrhizobium diazoefficiens]BAC50085.1 bll4820 [Bradyrhizobium diazoefficiens USDA 110]
MIPRLASREITARSSLLLLRAHVMRDFRLRSAAVMVAAARSAGRSAIALFLAHVVRDLGLGPARIVVAVLLIGGVGRARLRQGGQRDERHDRGSDDQLAVTHSGFSCLNLSSWCQSSPGGLTERQPNPERDCLG